MQPKEGLCTFVLVVFTATIWISSVQAVVVSSVDLNSIVRADNIFPIQANVAFQSISKSKTANDDVSLIENFQILLSDAQIMRRVYENYRASYGKNLDESSINVLALEDKQEIFRQRLIEIAEHNLNGNLTWWKEVNEFSEMSDEEFQSIYTRAQQSDELEYDFFTPNLTDLSQESSKDWRDDGMVTPVKNQGRCGSCYAFAGVASLETWYASKNGQLMDLSEQEIVSCGRRGCGGDGPRPTFDYMKNGIASTQNYPYQSGNGAKGQCQASGKQKYGSFAKYDKIRSESDLATFVASKGVVWIGINSKDWQSYSGGVFDGCGRKLDGRNNHAVAVVGFAEDHWIIKNSWGTGWASRQPDPKNKGYMLLKRGCNACDIMADAWGISG